MVTISYIPALQNCRENDTLVGFFFSSTGYRAFTKSKDGSLCLAMEFGGDKSLNDLIESRNEEGLGPFPAAVILKVALHMARGLKVRLDTPCIVCFTIPKPKGQLTLKSI